MHFVEEHLNRYHLLHKPHKWFLAFLCSPIHYLEMHYKKRYHLKFEHARKLFIFDILLVLTMLAIGASALTWYLYDPTVSRLVYIEITPSSPRILSGEYVTYKINIKNDSTATLASSKLSLTLPDGFILDKTEPMNNFQNNVFQLDEFAPKTAQEVKISGWIYGTPNKEEHLSATLVYHQKGRDWQEEKTTLLIKNLRGSLLEVKISAPDKALNQSIVPIAIKIKNNGKKDFNGIAIQLGNSGIAFAGAVADLGIIENNAWQIKSLPPQKTAELKAQIKIFPANPDKTLNIKVTPIITINGKSMPQAEAVHKFIIASPRLSISGAWQNPDSKIKPGEIAGLELILENISNVNLEQLEIQLFAPSAIVNLTQLQKLNLGYFKNQIFHISSAELPNLKALKIGEKITQQIHVPIQNFPEGGDDLNVRLGIKITSKVEGIPIGLYEANENSLSLHIGTKTALLPEIRYFTNEGDQLGRGPLPPQVGQETKYWAFLQITNSTSKIENLKLSADLPSDAVWTGKSSVSYGQNISYDSRNRRITWTAKSLPAHSQVGIYFEIALTPTNNQLGTHPLLLTNINLSAHDAYIDEDIAVAVHDLDSSLPNDFLAQQRGTAVIE